MGSSSLRIGLAIAMGVCFCILVAFNLFSMRTFAKSGLKDVRAARVIRIINAVLLIGAFGLVVYAIVRG